MTVWASPFRTRPGEFKSESGPGLRKHVRSGRGGAGPGGTDSTGPTASESDRRAAATVTVSGAEHVTGKVERPVPARRLSAKAGRHGAPGPPLAASAAAAVTVTGRPGRWMSPGGPPRAVRARPI